jgi:hypothetical protein
MSEPQQHETAPEDGPQGLASRAILDDAVEVVVRWRRRWPEGPLDGAGAPAADVQTLRDLLDFFRDSKDGLLTPEEVGGEAAMWQQVLPLEWPVDEPDLVPVVQAVDVLAGIPSSRPAWRPVVG